MALTQQDIRDAGLLMICGFQGHNLDAELKEILREVKPLGLILFSRNIESPEHVAALSCEIKRYMKHNKLLISVDQEGGRVARIKAPATVWPSMRSIGNTSDTQIAYRVGQALAQELRAMHIDLNFAPVLDVDTNPDNPVIGARAFSNDPVCVADMGIALFKGLHAGGVGACGKHFPGHGDTHVDSHLALPTISHNLQRLREVEWVPFKAAIAAGLDAIMTAHVVIEALDDVPATLSQRVLGHLRDELNFSGIIIGDDIDMKALADHETPENIAKRGLQAGVDIFLACNNPDSMMRLFRGIMQCAHNNSITPEAFLAAQKRAIAFRDRYYQPCTTPFNNNMLGTHTKLLHDIAASQASC